MYVYAIIDCAVRRAHQFEHQFNMNWTIFQHDDDEDNIPYGNRSVQKNSSCIFAEEKCFAIFKTSPRH